jgi:hypothetical protein
MRKLVYLAATMFILAGCAGNKELIKIVSFDTNCPADQITVLERSDSFGSGLYKVNACGKELKYKRTGTVYHAADKSPIP